MPKVRSNRDVLRRVNGYKLWYVQTTEYYSVLKTNELSSREKTRRNLNCVMLGERSQSEKAPRCTVSNIWRSVKGRTVDAVNRPVAVRVKGKEGVNRRSAEDF